jgi:hypothetical protein
MYRILDFIRLYVAAEGSLVEPVENRHFYWSPSASLVKYTCQGVGSWP